MLPLILLSLFISNIQCFDLEYDYEEEYEEIMPCSTSEECPKNQPICKNSQCHAECSGNKHCEMKGKICQNGR